MNYLYGKLNEQVYIDTYTGQETGTATVTVNNSDNTISVDVKTDNAMSDTSVNPVQNKAIKAYVDSIIASLREEIMQELNANMQK